MEWSRVALVIALALPLAGLVPLLVLGGDGERWARRGALASAALWVVILIAGERPEVGALHPDQLAAASAAGVALAAAAAAAARAPWTGVAATLVSLGLVTTKGASLDPGALVVGLAGAVVVLVWTASPPRVLTATAAISVALLAGGLHTGNGGLGLWLVAAGAGLLVAVAGTAAGPFTVLLAAGLAFGIRWFPAIDHADHLAWAGTGLALAAAATALLVAREDWRWTIGPAVPLALWSLVAATDVGGARAAAGLFAAAAVLVAVLGGRVAVLAALPAAAVLLGALVDGGAGGRRVALVAAAAVVTVGALVAAAGRQRAAPTQRTDLEVAAPALLAGLWLVVAPSMWRWARPGALDAYEEGIAIALAVGVASVVALVARGASAPALASLLDGAGAVPQAPRHHRAEAVVATALAIVAIALVRSAGFTSPP